MNIGMLAKWFYDNNFLVREDINQERLKYLVFTTASSLGLEDNAVIENRKIIMDIKFEDYEFKEATINLLNSINRAIGYQDNCKDSYMFDSILIELGDDFKTTFTELSKYYRNFRDEVLEEFDNYNFNKKVIRVGENIYFLNFDKELTSEEMKSLEVTSNNQKVYEVYLQDGELISYERRVFIRRSC